jgi:glycosyltransferase involved in cell wall biosynthesis
MDKKIKVVAIADDIRIPSGVGIQCKKILTGLLKTNKYEVVELAGSLVRGDMNPVMYKGVKLYPTGGEAYGNTYQLRLLLQIEKPDILLIFSDPRFFQYVFNMDDEIRQNCKLVFYHTWDNAPFPRFNLPFYRACDEIIMISEFSYELMKSGEVHCYHIPHMQDPTEFFPLPADKVQEERNHFQKLLNLPRLDFIIFYNNRNLDRKRPGDVINIFDKFNKKHPNSILLMNTHAIDPEGTDLLQIQNEYVRRQIPILYNFNRVDNVTLNLFYNAADITISIPYAEGFGLCVSESLLASTPVVATRTGGITEQMSFTEHHEAVSDADGKGYDAYDEEITFGKLIDPAVRNLFGTPGSAYIYRDYVRDEDVLDALEVMYNMKENNKLDDLGIKGRDYVSRKYNENDIVQKWDTILTNIYNKSSEYRRINLVEV